MSLLSQCTSLHAELAERPDGPRQAVSTTTINVETDLEALANAVEAALPHAVVNDAAIHKNGLSPLGDGKPMIPFAVKQRHPVKASVTVYYNGKVVWAGLEPCYPAR